MLRTKDIYIYIFKEILYLQLSRISGIQQNYWPDIRSNQYPAQPYLYYAIIISEKIEQSRNTSEKSVLTFSPLYDLFFFKLNGCAYF